MSDKGTKMSNAFKDIDLLGFRTSLKTIAIGRKLELSLLRLAKK